MLGLVHEDVGCSLGVPSGLMAGSPVMWLARAPAVAAFAARQLWSARRGAISPREVLRAARPRVLEEAGS